MAKTTTFRLRSKDSIKAPDLAPDRPFWAIGDVHGRYDLLAPLLERLLAGSDPIVLLGDYIAKGPDSAAVLRLLQEATADGQVIALRGNHEDLLLRYLQRPRVLTDTFLAYGGGATLQSFGVACDPPIVDPKAMSALRNDLRACLGDLEDWIAARPYLYRSGNVAAVHAGVAPHLPLEAQHGPSLCWGHPHFTKIPRTDGVWIVHGHVPVPAISIKERRIAIDTQAHASGTLSAVHIARGSIRAL